MTLQEYYEKYWTVEGKPASPLTDSEKWMLERMFVINKDAAMGMLHGIIIRKMIGPRPKYKPLNNSSNGEKI